MGHLVRQLPLSLTQTEKLGEFAQGKMSPAHSLGSSPTEHEDEIRLQTLQADLQQFTKSLPKKGLGPAPLLRAPLQYALHL